MHTVKGNQLTDYRHTKEREMQVLLIYVTLPLCLLAAPVPMRVPKP